MINVDVNTNMVWGKWQNNKVERARQQHIGGRAMVRGKGNERLTRLPHIHHVGRQIDP